MTETTALDDITLMKIRVTRFDTFVAPRIRDELLDLVRQGARKIVLDLQQVAFVDSSGLGAMVSGVKALDGQGDIVLCGASDAVRTLLRLTRMDRVFRIVADFDAACACWRT
ncbi:MULTISPECIES: STAS domain-containing protein [Burkholderia]|uniref:Anti-sigma factor antagonist n=1 Tax=Burkholderia paludis TaxID=1506587 RepID=A0A6J5CW50_9BURK|nr:MULTISPECIES: STAS domain-containing protein [Burkholderia]CAB3746189.1 Anti-sigma-B factor antagonist [Burkholderia paludis]VWB23650.1 Anti-sigma factor antagonist [Burkholderia paludis]